MIWINILNEIFLYLPLKEAPMAKHNSKAAGKLAETAKESALLRMLRIDGSQNGAKLRTRIVRDKTKYNRNVKHKKSLAFSNGLKSLADARDFAFIGLLSRKWSEDALGLFCHKASCAFIVFIKVVCTESGDRSFFVVKGFFGFVAGAKQKVCVSL